jgi:homopolymeric O-antigen transport system ATP-binding protein
MEDLKSPAPSGDPFAVVVRDVSKVYKLYPDHKARMKEALSLSGKAYHKDFYALKKVSFEVRRGEVLGIVGKNGSGKSSLLKIIAGVIPPTEGYVGADGTVAALLELGSAFNPEFNGLENVYFYGSVLGFPRSFLDRKLEEILAFADIGEFIHQPIKKYSSGMKSRLAFAVAINVNPDILILDEVLAVGDELFRRKCHARMEAFIKKGDKTILYVTHNVASVNEICSRAMVLDRGELILRGPSRPVTAHYQRYLFCNPQDALEIREEMLSLNRSGALDSQSRADKPEAPPRPLGLAGLPEEAPNPPPDQGPEQKPYYIPNLIPKSTMEYRYHDVEIGDVAIRTRAGEKVNSLVVNERYVYSYKVRFNVSAQNVFFAMTFKTQRGIKVATANTQAMGKPTLNAEKGEEYLVEWDFVCRLLSKTYYADAGAFFLKDYERRILNRVVDAMVFFVQKMPQKCVKGLVHLGQAPNVTRIG